MDVEEKKGRNFIVQVRQGNVIVTHVPLDAPSFDLAGEERLLQGMVDEGALITPGRWLHGQHCPELLPAVLSKSRSFPEDKGPDGYDASALFRPGAIYKHVSYLYYICCHLIE
jgi:hypothetical protein